MIEKFLRLFEKYRELEELVSALEACECRSRKEIASLQSMAASDSNLIASLNRYIAMLETKINHQNILLHDIKMTKQLEACLPDTQTNKNARSGMPRALHMETDDELNRFQNKNNT